MTGQLRGPGHRRSCSWAGPRTTMVGHVRDALRETGGRLRDRRRPCASPSTSGARPSAASGTRYERAGAGRRPARAARAPARRPDGRGRPAAGPRAPGRCSARAPGAAARSTPWSSCATRASLERRGAPTAGTRSRTGSSRGLRRGRRAGRRASRRATPTRRRSRWYRDHDLSTVDNVDDTAGQAALVFVAGRGGGRLRRQGHRRRAAAAASSAAPRRPDAARRRASARGR